MNTIKMEDESYSFIHEEIFNNLINNKYERYNKYLFKSFIKNIFNNYINDTDIHEWSIDKYVYLPMIMKILISKVDKIFDFIIKRSKNKLRKMFVPLLLHHLYRPGGRMYIKIKKEFNKKI